MHIHCHCPTKFRTDFQVPQFSLNWIFTVVTGRCPFIQIIVRKRPGAGMGLFQFCRMPFGLAGAPSSFQRMMDYVLRGLPFVVNYIDDTLVHSANEDQHKHHLREVFQRLKTAGLTLRGKKCHIGMSQVTYLGHVFSGSGMDGAGGTICKLVPLCALNAQAEGLRFWPPHSHSFLLICSLC